MNFRVTTTLLMLCFTLFASAQEQKKLYKWIDENGNVHYSDEPHKGAEEIQIREVPTVKMKAPKFEGANLREFGSRQEQGVEEALYDSVALTEPANNGVVRNNAGAVTLKASVQPSLYEDHRLRFFIDGRPVGGDSASGSNEVTIEDVAYGEHSAFVVIIDEAGKQVQQSKANNFVLLHTINPNIRKQRNQK